MLDDEPGTGDVRDGRISVLVGARGVRDQRDGEHLVRRETVADERAVARLEHVERQDCVGEENHLRQREERHLLQRGVDLGWMSRIHGERA